MKSNRVIKLCEVIFLTTLIICRFFSKESRIEWINTISLSGILIATFDLYYTLIVIDQRKKKTAVKIKAMIGGIVLVIVIVVVLLAMIFSGLLIPNEAWKDVFTLIALLISLPQRLYVDIILSIKKKKE